MRLVFNQHATLPCPLAGAASAAEEARASAESRHREAAARAEELAATLARAERKAGLLAKEREGLKAILASYDEEYLNHQGVCAGLCTLCALCRPSDGQRCAV